jgi:FHS family L-fucose permease-like MFS transporter
MGRHSNMALFLYVKRCQGALADFWSVRSTKLRCLFGRWKILANFVTEKDLAMEQKTHSLVKREYVLPFILVTSLFFMWGFARSILDVLNKHFQDTMHITMVDSAKVQATTYLGYFLMALPAGLFITRWGYRKGVVLGLLLFACGSLLFIPSESIGSFEWFLGSLFVVGCGLVFLETAANPYITQLGDSATGASRLNLAQSFNGLGCIIAPALVAPLLFSEGKDASVALPYSIMGVIVLVIALIFSRVKLPEINDSADDNGSAQKSGKVILSLLRNSHFMLGVGALFFYEISEIAINSFFINYVTSDGWMSAGNAAITLSFGGLGLFMVARVVGGWVMSRVAAQRVLLVCAVMTVLGSALVVADLGIISKIGLFSCYAFEAIMFPTIFAICVGGLGSETKIASSFLMMTPLGGAVGSMMMGYVADLAGMSTAFIVPCVGYIVVLIYALRAQKKVQR